MYDPYHSSLEVQVVADLYRTSLGLKLSPVFAERRGPDDGQQGRKYDHDSSALVVLDLSEVVVFREQLGAFISGQLAEVILPRAETKRLVLAAADTYFEPNHPEFKIHQGGLAVSIEEDANEKSDGRSIVFISRQHTVQLVDGGEPTLFFPELQALLAVVDSFIGNCARVDFASVRLLERAGGGEERPAGPPAPQPVRRSGGLGAPGAARSPIAPPAGGEEEGGAEAAGSEEKLPAVVRGGRRGVSQTNSVSDTDIDAALGSTSAADVESVLGSVPKF